MSPSSPKVSIVMATWKRAHLIGRAIESVRRQTLQDWELIILDDGSPDNTAEVVRGWAAKDKRINYLPLPRQGSIAKVSNVGLRAARAGFIAILDDDDWWFDDRKLEKQVAFLEKHPDYVACGGGFVIVDKEGVETTRILKPEQDEAIRRIALSANPIVNGTALFRSSVGIFYDEAIFQFADWDFWLALGKRGKLYNFQEYFLAYRLWDDSSSFRNQRGNARAAVQIVEKYKDAYPGYTRAALMTRAYLAYTFLPVFLRRGLNASLSKLKKRIFSR